MTASNDTHINNFKVFEKPKLFADAVQPLSYRLVLLHAMHSQAKKDNKIVKSVTEDILNVINGNKKFFYKPGCIEIYQFDKDNGTGLLLVDRSGGCYPLVIYPKDKKPNHGARDIGLKKAVTDIYNQSNEIQNLLVKYTSWNEDLVKQLIQKFDNSGRNAA